MANGKMMKVFFVLLTVAAVIIASFISYTIGSKVWWHKGIRFAYLQCYRDSGCKQCEANIRYEAGLLD